MKKTRFMEEQMVSILREADQRPVPEVAKRAVSTILRQPGSAIYCSDSTVRMSG
jgi:hypothetical protein